MLFDLLMFWSIKGLNISKQRSIFSQEWNGIKQREDDEDGLVCSLVVRNGTIALPTIPSLSESSFCSSFHVCRSLQRRVARSTNWFCRSCRQPPLEYSVYKAVKMETYSQGKMEELKAKIDGYPEQ
ncbi:uncharacterized protein LOC116189280 isoform X4 [Punica granatum]|uniref:Uncharacterized protein LOC116189280 isoform X4 n=1 Tax=Punica granatum TaxID=22663 RepID=A0A6P8BWL2_PUNGR|nr:uncharacterized protein LOC116189280 isoform X4 [Punica granatum]